MRLLVPDLAEVVCCCLASWPLAAAAVSSVACSEPLLDAAVRPPCWRRRDLLRVLVVGVVKDCAVLAGLVFPSGFFCPVRLTARSRCPTLLLAVAS